MEHDERVKLEELQPDELAELLAGEDEEIDEEQAQLLREFIANAGGAEEALELLEEMLRKAA
jgi:hypothetical protein